MKIRNVSPRGDLDVPLLGRTVRGGETVTVTPEQAQRLIGQVDVWAPADAAAVKLASKEA